MAKKFFITNAMLCFWPDNSFSVRCRVIEDARLEKGAFIINKGRREGLQRQPVLSYDNKTQL